MDFCQLVQRPGRCGRASQKQCWWSYSGNWDSLDRACFRTLDATLECTNAAENADFMFSKWYMPCSLTHKGLDMTS